MAEGHQLSEELLEACERGELGTVQKLISRGANPYMRVWSVTTALHVAARYVYMCVLS
jgi:ankyrin repeat protein